MCERIAAAGARDDAEAARLGKSGGFSTSDQVQSILASVAGSNNGQISYAFPSTANPIRRPSAAVREEVEAMDVDMATRYVGDAVCKGAIGDA